MDFRSIFIKTIEFSSKNHDLLAISSTLRIRGGLHEVEGLRERVVCVVTAEDREGLAARLQLLLPGLLALLPLLARGKSVRTVLAGAKAKS